MPSNAGGRFWAHVCLFGAQGRDAGEPDVASSSARALCEAPIAIADLGAAIGHWRQGPSSSHGAARLDARLDAATSATLAARCGSGSLSSLHEVVLGCLNDQTTRTQGGDGEGVIVWAAVAPDGWRNAGKDMAP